MNQIYIENIKAEAEVKIEGYKNYIKEISKLPISIDKARSIWRVATDKLMLKNIEIEELIGKEILEIVIEINEIDSYMDPPVIFYTGINTIEEAREWVRIEKEVTKRDRKWIEVIDSIRDFFSYRTSFKLTLYVLGLRYFSYDIGSTIWRIVFKFGNIETKINNIVENTAKWIVSKLEKEKERIHIKYTLKD